MVKDLNFISVYPISIFFSSSLFVLIYKYDTFSR